MKYVPPPPQFVRDSVNEALNYIHTFLPPNYHVTLVCEPPDNTNGRPVIILTSREPDSLIKVSHTIQAYIIGKKEMDETQSN